GRPFVAFDVMRRAQPREAIGHLRFRSRPIRATLSCNSQLRSNGGGRWLSTRFRIRSATRRTPTAGPLMPIASWSCGYSSRPTRRNEGRAGRGSTMAAAASDAQLMTLARAIAAGDEQTAARLLAASPMLARACFVKGASRQSAHAYFLDRIGRYIYAGETALHVAAAAYRPDVARKPIAAGAVVRARNLPA